MRLLSSSAAIVALPSFSDNAHALTFSNTTDSNLTIAMVRTAPPNWPKPLLNYDWTGIELNISATVDAGIKYIHNAAAQGADAITFPELWFPGFPKGKDDNNWTTEYLPMYINNSIVVGDSNWLRLIDGIKSAGIYTALAFSEVDADRLYMSQALISPLGDVLIHRHKLRPSGSERYFFSDGSTDEFLVVTTDKLGRVGLLECYEHYYASMTFPMQAQRESVHFGPYPYLADVDDPEALWWESALSSIAAMRHYSILSGSYSLMNSIGYAAAFDSNGNTIAEMKASVDLDEHPILYAEIDASGFNVSEQYDVDGQASWATAKQILDSLPGYIPRVEGKLVPRVSHSVAWLASGGLTTEVAEEMDYGG